LIIGCLKEIKNNENRVAITPQGVEKFVNEGHTVLIEKNAGIGSGISNEEFEKAGAKIIDSPEKIVNESELILKVKEPLKQERKLFTEGKTLFTYFHFASDKQLTEEMLASKSICIAYETVELDDGSLPLLAPMSAIAGRMAPQIGAYYLAKFVGGRGILIGGVDGVKPANVVILGGGFVGFNAALIASGMKANVTILEINEKRIEYLKKILPENVSFMHSTPENIEKAVLEADILIGAVLVKGAKAPVLVSKELVSKMKKGSVIIDVAVDQGGSVETIKPTTHENPVYTVNGVIHYGVANMPGAFPRTATFALTKQTLPFALELANKGIEKAVKENNALKKGVNIFKGHITCKGVAEAFNMPFTPIENLL
jgi:alanine dehydrogenase